MKHIIMGTAGHVDHGKTTLINALTGFNCDTHKQEKERGITINLGFTNFKLTDNDSISIVDVPGHKDFIHTMASGIGGMDFVLFVIAADEGVMPQSKEHFNIIKFLGIEKAIFVITKKDLVDEEFLELVEADIDDLVEGSVFEQSKKVAISSTTGDGIEDLKQEIVNLIKKLPEKMTDDIFRMYIDRIFSVKGVGTVVNGSVLSGKINKSDEVYLLPQNEKIRIKGIQKHHNDVEQVFAGDRASMNISSLKVSDFERGMLLSDQKINSTDLIDVSVDLFSGNLSLWSEFILILGTNRLMVKGHLIDKESLLEGEKSLMQIYLPKKIVIRFADRFIIRNSSNTKTLGGGIILDPFPLHHRRRRKKQIEILKKISYCDFPEIVANEVRKSILPLKKEEIADKISVKIEKLDLIELPDDIREIENSLIDKKLLKKWETKILSILRNFHEKNFLLETGLSAHELISNFDSEKDKENLKILQKILEEMVSSSKLKAVKDSFVLQEHEVSLTADDKVKVENILEFLSNSEELVYSSSIIQEKFKKNPKTELYLKYLVNENEIVFKNNKYIHKKVLENCKNILKDYLKKNSGIKLSVFRDLMKTNRNTAMEILEYFDSIGFTKREDNLRTLM